MPRAVRTSVLVTVLHHVERHAVLRAHYASNAGRLIRHGHCVSREAKGQDVAQPALRGAFSPLVPALVVAHALERTLRGAVPQRRRSVEGLHAFGSVRVGLSHPCRVRLRRFRPLLQLRTVPQPMPASASMLNCLQIPTAVAHCQQCPSITGNRGAGIGQGHHSAGRTPAVCMSTISFTPACIAAVLASLLFALPAARAGVLVARGAGGANLHCCSTACSTPSPAPSAWPSSSFSPASSAFLSCVAWRRRLSRWTQPGGGS